MRLAIADPPYLGRSRTLYGGGRPASFVNKRRGESARTDNHPAAAEWDIPDTHHRLVEQLIASYDGWAIAMAVDSLRYYLQWVPPSARVCVWNKPNAFPTASRLIPTWEPVLILIPESRRTASTGQTRRDVLTAPKINNVLIGAKPPAWTRWVLDALQYDPELDTVDDLFGGSGAVTAEINQQVLL